MKRAAASECMDLEICEAIRQNLDLRFGARMKAVWLYGSRARGVAKADSDWDIAAVVEGYDGDFAMRKPLGRVWQEMYYEYGADVHVLLISPEQLQAETALTTDIRRDGVPL